jgi:serine/threonine protein kinase
MRPFGAIDDSDIENEVRAVEMVCRVNPSKNIVCVLAHGLLRNSPYYFIDMELCDINLEKYMDASGLVPSCLSPLYLPGSNEADVTRIWDIAVGIVQGLDYMHNLGVVHRDLKPRNSSSHCRD